MNTEARYGKLSTFMVTAKDLDKAKPEKYHSKKKWFLAAKDELMTHIIKGVTRAVFAECFMNCLPSQEALLPAKALMFCMYPSAEHNKKEHNRRKNIKNKRLYCNI